MPVDPISAAAAAAALWLLDKSVGGVVSDYAKRFWFAAIERLSGKNRTARRQVEEARAEAAKLKPMVNRVLEDNAYLFGLVRNLQIKNAALQDELESTRRDSPELRGKICTRPECPLDRRAD